MTEDNVVLIEAFRRLVADTVTPAAIRAIEAGGGTEPVWGTLSRSGFLDALVPDHAGGAGLALREIYALLRILGEHAAPVPFGETMVIRGLAAQLGGQLPDEAVAVFGAESAVIPGAAHATHALIQNGDQAAIVGVSASGADLFRAGGATGLSHGASLWAGAWEPGMVLLAAAATVSAHMAGAMARILDMTLAHARDRQQFGRPLGKFQAIQQQIAVMAEQVLSAQVAVRTAFAGERFDTGRVAAAKCRANEAATIVCNIAHAVHGAIGVTEEFDLQLYTRRIKQWQIAYGSETFWGARLGRLRAASAVTISADFLRLHLATAENMDD